MKTKSSPPARRPSEEESQRPARQQADRKDHGKEGHYSPAQSLEKPRRHEVVGGDQQQLMGQHADSMADRTVTSGGWTTGPAPRWRAHSISSMRVRYGNAVSCNRQGRPCGLFLRCRACVIGLFRTYVRGG